MNLRQIEVFRAVMLTGSVTAAAQWLHVSQPGVSRMLAHMEQRLGMPLFERHKGRLLPTPEAQVLYGEVERVYGGVQRIQDCAQALKAGEGQTLRVVASPSTMLALLPTALTQLVARYPAARVTTETLTRPEMLRQLLDHEADLAISTVALDHPLLQARPVGSWTLVCAYPQGHPFAQQAQVDMAEVVQQPLVGFAPETTQGRFVADWCARQGVAPHSPVQVRSGLNACALVASGAGVAIVDDLTARAWRGAAIGFAAVPQAPVTPVLAVTPTQRPPSLLCRALADLVSQSAPPP